MAFGSRVKLEIMVQYAALPSLPMQSLCRAREVTALSINTWARGANIARTGLLKNIPALLKFWQKLYPEGMTFQFAADLEKAIQVAQVRANVVAGIPNPRADIETVFSDGDILEIARCGPDFEAALAIIEPAIQRLEEIFILANFRIAVEVAEVRSNRRQPAEPVEIAA